MSKTPKRQAGQLLLFEEDSFDNSAAERSSTFLDNLSLPVHRWFRYSAGFSAQWVREIIDREKKNGRTRVLDPFAGSGTVILEAESAKVHGIGAEAHPFVCRVAQAKCKWRENPNDLEALAVGIVERAKRSKNHSRPFPELLTKCYPTETLNRLESLRLAWAETENAT